MTVLSIDFETRSTVNLRTTGVYPYAEHPTTDIWCMAWAFDDEEPEIWWPRHAADFLGAVQHGVECPKDANPKADCDCDGNPYYLPLRITDHIHAGGEIRAWNADFERIIWRRIMHERYGYPNPALEQWHDTAAEAAAMSLPMSLDLACKVCRVPFQKDNEGYNLMMRMTRPRSKKGQPLTWWYDKDRLLRLGDYCKSDVRAERAMKRVTRRLNSLEREHYLEICRQNDAGITIDVPLVKAMRAVADEGLERANAALEELTAGEVEVVTDHVGLREWVNSRGVETTSVAKKVVRELLSSDLDPDVRDALQLRADAGRTSLAKLDKSLEVICADGKAHGLLVYHGASTGRESAKLLQPHNYPRGEIASPDPKNLPDWKYVEQFIPAMLREAYDEIDLFHPPIVVISSLLRPTLTAAPGHELIAADYSGIEARVVNWLAGQEDMLDNFRAMDAGDKSRDPYVINAMRYYNMPFEKITKGLRQTGKFQELGMGFGMGAETGQRQAKDVYGLTLTLEQTQEMVRHYRMTHPKVKQWWSDLNDAAIAAVEYPGHVTHAGKYIRFIKRGAYLYMLLPAGRPLVYAQPKIIERRVPWSTPEKPETRPAVQIMAVHPKTKQWWSQDMYGGIWAENGTQAVARDIMAEGKLRARAEGYPSILTVHDEVVSEVPEGYGDVKVFEQILTTLPAWAAGLPVAAEGWRGFRYRK